MDSAAPPTTYAIRPGDTSDVQDVEKLFSSHYPSNLTSKDPGSADRLRKELEGIQGGSTILVVALQSEVIIGAALAVTNRNLSRYEPDSCRPIGYLSKSVVHTDCRRRGIGGALVAARIAELKKRGVDVIYSSHHADNIGSAKALDAHGFEYVETYHDPEKRPTGTRMTSVRRLVVS